MTWFLSQLRPVHPRACGEHLGRLAAYTTIGGSSPRVRGTPLPQLRHGLLPRFIPARAGNTGAQSPHNNTQPVHPRACGEHRRFRNLNHVQYGSSPRVRGTPSKRPVELSNSRFIPARAGNTQSRYHMIPSRAVHPRACGEHARQCA